MTKDIMKKGRILESEIYQTESDIDDIRSILNDYDNFGSNITFKRNSDNFSRSFGTKKYIFKSQLYTLLCTLLVNKEEELIQLNREFESL